MDVFSSWSSTKFATNKADSNRTGLYKHFLDGSPNDSGPEKNHIRLTLVDFTQLRTGSGWQDTSLDLSAGVLNAMHLRELRTIGY